MAEDTNVDQLDRITTWSYRILASEDSEFGETVYALHEVYYEGDKPLSWTAEPITFTSDTSRADLISALTQALDDAHKRPVLWIEDNRLVTELDRGLRDRAEGRVRPSHLRSEEEE